MKCLISNEEVEHKDGFILVIVTLCLLLVHLCIIVSMKVSNTPCLNTQPSYFILIYIIYRYIRILYIYYINLIAIKFNLRKKIPDLFEVN